MSVSLVTLPRTFRGPMACNGFFGSYHAMHCCICKLRIISGDYGFVFFNTGCYLHCVVRPFLERNCSSFSRVSYD